MKVVLVTKIKNLGNIGDIVDVKSGFARNFLLPYHKALPATEKYIQDFEEKKEEYLKKAKDELSLAEANAIHLEDLRLTADMVSLRSSKCIAFASAKDNSSFAFLRYSSFFSSKS